MSADSFAFQMWTCAKGGSGTHINLSIYECLGSLSGEAYWVGFSPACRGKILSTTSRNRYLIGFDASDAGEFAPLMLTYILSNCNQSILDELRSL